MSFARQIFRQHDLARLRHKLLLARDFHLGAPTDGDYVPWHIRVMPIFKKSRSNVYHVGILPGYRFRPLHRRVGTGNRREFHIHLLEMTQPIRSCVTPGHGGWLMLLRNHKVSWASGKEEQESAQD
jgi:hypothetical protein